jgi:hypothetical protein
MMRYIILVLMLMGISFATIAQEVCPTIVNTALDAVDNLCSGIGRNQVCYGNSRITVTQYTPNDQFSQVGDIDALDNMKELTLSPMNESDNEWGVAWVKMQANLPNSVPGQAVNMLLFGGVSIQSTVAEYPSVSAQTTGNARIRREPNTTGNNIITVIPSNTTITLVGRNASNDWFVTTSADEVGWVSSQVLSISGDTSTLTLIEGELPVFQTPMQAFVLSSGVGGSPCAETPPNGILIQTPQGAGEIQLTINGIEVSLGSTAFVQAQAGEILQMSVLEGFGRLRVDNIEVVVPAGSFSTVPLGADGLANDAPSPAQPYDPANLPFLPVTTLATPITIAPPIAQETLAQLQFRSQAGGTWTVTRTGGDGSGCPNRDGLVDLDNGGGMLIYSSVPIITLTLRADASGTSLESSNKWVFPNNDIIYYTLQPDGSFLADYSDNNFNSDGPTFVGYTSRLVLISATSATLEESFTSRNSTRNCSLRATFSLSR